MNKLNNERYGISRDCRKGRLGFKIMVGVRRQILKVRWEMMETTTGCHVCGGWVGG